jgi:hypothetical protein
MTSSRVRKITVSCTLLLLVSCNPGSLIKADGDNGNSIRSEYDFRGGQLTREVTYHSINVESATLRITGESGTSEYPMSTVGRDRFSATCQIPANRDSSGADKTYRVSSVIIDKTGTEHVTTEVITVKAATAPPDPPSP